MKLELYGFQKRSVNKFLPVTNCLNCDDMGLGKTVQAIALDFAKRNQYKKVTGYGAPPTLIVAQSAALETPWVEHLERYWPEARLNVYSRNNHMQFVANLLSSFRLGDGALYHYHIIYWEALRRVPELQRVMWFHVIADEVHRAKNRYAQMTQALKRIPTMNKYGLSGTAADNQPGDFWSILNWLYPRVFTSQNKFNAHHLVQAYHNKGDCAVCGKYHRTAHKKIEGVKNVQDLHRAIEPFYVRRLKDAPEVGLDLPEKTYSLQEVVLGPQQRRAYDQMRKDMLAWVGDHEDEPIAAPIVVAQLQRLQQFALGYAQTELVERRVKDPYSSTGWRKKMVWTVRLSEPSAKLDTLMEMVEDNGEEPFVVFSQSAQVIGLLVARLERAGISHVSLTGNTPQEDRGDMVARFQRGDARIFAGTIKTGGVSITLTRARTMVFLDRHWSPSVNAQAEDRIHRIGQRRNVQIIDFVARNTIDFGRLTRIEQKWSWIKEILGDDVTQMQRRFTRGTEQ